MTLQRIALFAATLAITAVFGGCASAPSHYYTLNATSTSSSVSAVRGNVSVGPVTVPASVDQPQFVTQASPNRVDVDEFNRWASPLSDNIARVVAQNLVILLGTPNVAIDPLANFIPNYAVAIDVQRFESVRGQRAYLVAVWTVRSTAVGGATRSGRTEANEPVSDDTFDALAAAHSRALAMLSGNIADAVRAEAIAQP
jgi:uncharacterized protein